MISHDRLLRRTEVEEIVRLSRSTIYHLMKFGQFPAPPRARGSPMDYADKLPPRPWYIFTPPQRYNFAPPLTLVPRTVPEE